MLNERKSETIKVKNEANEIAVSDKDSKQMKQDGDKQLNVVKSIENSKEEKQTKKDKKAKESGNKKEETAAKKSLTKVKNLTKRLKRPENKKVSKQSERQKTDPKIKGTDKNDVLSFAGDKGKRYQK